MSLSARPAVPTPQVLADARDELAGRLGMDPTSLEWEVGSAMHRKRSTVFPLQLRSADGGTVGSAFYKAPFFPDAGQRPRRNLERARAALTRSKELGDRFALAATGEGIAINTTLGFDPATLEVVTLGVAGRPMGNPVVHSSTSRRRAAIHLACERVGAAVRLLEGFDIPDPGAERDRIWGETERKLGAAGSILSPDELRALEANLGRLLGEAFDRQPSLVMAHGDLGPSNVLVGTATTGIIDFMWTPHLQGFDLARFTHRLSSAALATRRWTGSLVDATLDGYGDRSAPDQPGWRFTTLQRALATALRPRRSPWDRSARQALAQIRSAL